MVVFIIGGASSSRGAGNTDAYLIKVDSAGTLKWSASYGSEEIEWVRDIVVLNDGFLLIGYSNQNLDKGYDGYVIRTDPQGKVIWENMFGGPNWEFLYKGISTSDGGFLMVGETYSYSNGDADLYAVKIDPNGVLLWEKNFGGSKKDKASAVLESEDKQYLILGTWTKDNDENEIGIVNLDEKGVEIDTHFFEDTLSNEAASFVKIRDIGFGIVGTTIIDGKRRILTLGTNEKFGVIWKTIDPKNGEKNDEGRAIVQSVVNNDVVVLGKMESYGAGLGDFGYYIRDNRGGWRASSTIGGEKLDDGYGIFACKDGGYVMVGTTESFDSKYSSVILIKVDKKGKYDEDDYKHYEDVTLVKKIDSEINGKVYPNPFNEESIIDLSHYKGKFPLTFSITSIDGKQVREFTTYFTKNKINSSQIGKGLFFLKATNPENNTIFSGKIISY